MTKRDRNIVIGVFLAVLAIYGSFWLLYYISMQESNQKAVLRKCEENLNESFEAIVTNVERYEYDSFMHGRYFSFSIKTEDSISKSLSYLFNLPENKELLEFIKIGQKVRKQNGNNKFSLTDKTEIRLFIIPYCDMIKK